MLPFRATVGVPLRGAARRARRDRPRYVEPGRVFAESEISPLERFGEAASIALENARLYEAAQDELAHRRRTEEELLDTVARLSRSELELRRAHPDMIRRLADAAEFRDAETGRHGAHEPLLRASRAAPGPRRRTLRLIRAASPFDIGKIAVPDDVLLKPGPPRRTSGRRWDVTPRSATGSSPARRRSC